MDYRKALGVCAQERRICRTDDDGNEFTLGVVGREICPAVDDREKFARARHARGFAMLLSTRLLIATLALAMFGGCATARWSVIKQFRKPGESLQAFPEEVWSEYDCDSQKRPFLVIERNELSLTKVSAGNDFGHRMVYIMCPAHPTEVVTGKLSTRIRFKGNPIVQQMDSRYEIKPGRWVVDAIVHLPEQAEPGVYAYELEFDSGTLEFHKSLTFVVVKR